ncbi:hypothetical protein CJF32_00005849 [Rutstroemia sp. NJR-2017a WRK4]|nr:hypothetical protein CJF32_00005849 [Rutstroemia sp. NJR-2017a WRK4]
MALSQQPEFGNLLNDQDLGSYLSNNEDGPEEDNILRHRATREGRENMASKKTPEITTAYPVSSDDISRDDARKADERKGIFDPTQDYLPPPYDGDVWEPGWKQFPFTGVLALVGSFFFMVASIVILVVSAGQSPSDWMVSPTVYVAAFTTLSNLLAQYSFKQGAKIAWWYKALRGGTIGDLHHHWSHADGFFSALFAGMRLSWVTMASIAVTVMVVDQPLMQRASTIFSVEKVEQVNITAHVAPEVPWGFTGLQVGRAETDLLMTQPMLEAFNDFNSRSPITTGFSGCNDTCVGYIDAGGVSAMCNTTSRPIDYRVLEDSAYSVLSPFSVSWGLEGVAGNDPSNFTTTFITMQVTWTTNSSNNDSDWTGVLNRRSCFLTPATLQYPVKISDNTLTLLDVLAGGKVKSYQPVCGLDLCTDGGGSPSYWTIGGIYLAALNLFSSNATYTFSGGIGTYSTFPDILSNQFLDVQKVPLSSLSNFTEIYAPKSFNQNWTDPTSYILNSLNNIAFRLSLAASEYPYRNTSTRPAPQIVTMQQTSRQNVYHSEYRFLVGGAVLVAICTLFITPTYIGWSKLGRSVTLNPIETGKAFDAPLLRGPGSNAPLRKLMDSMSTKEVQMGEVEDYGPSPVHRLKLADPVEVRNPRAGVVYS